MRYTEPFVIEKYDGKRKIIIYGAGNYGEIAYEALGTFGIGVYAFADMGLAGKKFKGVDCISPGRLAEHKGDIIILATLNYFSLFYKNCLKLGIKK